MNDEKMFHLSLKPLATVRANDMLRLKEGDDRWYQRAIKKELDKNQNSW